MLLVSNPAPIQIDLSRGEVSVIKSGPFISNGGAGTNIVSSKYQLSLKISVEPLNILGIHIQTRNASSKNAVTRAHLELQHLSLRESSIPELLIAARLISATLGLLTCRPMES